MRLRGVLSWRMASRALNPDQETKLRGVIGTLSRRDRALLLLALHGGFRIRETLRVRVGDVWDGMQVRARLQIERRGLKGGAGVRRKAVSSRVVPLHPIAAGAIRDYLLERQAAGTLQMRGPLFLSREGGGALGVLQAWRVFRRALAAAGMTGVGYSTHATRKTFARRIYEASNHDIELTRAALGHASILSTQRYLRVADSEAERLILALGPDQVAN